LQPCLRQEVEKEFFWLTQIDELDLEALESAVRQTVMSVAARLIERHINSDLSDDVGSRYPCSCGHTVRYQGRREKEYSTTVGSLKLQRAYYHCSHCGKGFFPRDKALGLDEGCSSPGLKRMIATTAALVSFQETSQLLEELASIKVDAKQVERIAERLGEEIDQYERQETQPFEQIPMDSTMYLGCDGTGIPMRACELQGRSGKQPDGSAKTREVKLVTIWTAESRDSDGNPVRDQGSVTYSAAIESAKMNDTKEELSEFGSRVLREAQRRNFQHANRQVALGDGAPWIWNIIGELFPHAIQIVDRFHAKQHLAEICKVIWGADSQIGKDWLKERYAELDLGDIDKLIAAFKTHKRYPEVRRCIKYLKENRLRMNYAAFHAQELCTSSGVVEAGCKVAIGTRLKRAGMHWTLYGSNAIIALRCCKLSGRFEDFWEWRSQKKAS
jgi:hypothetical protein